MLGPAIEAAPGIGAIMAAQLGWSAEETKSQIARFEEIARGYLSPLSTTTSP